MNYVIITDTTVEKLYSRQLEADYCFSFTAGEKSKTRATKQAIEDGMLSNGLGKDTTILAIGGGVVLDMAGYIAATYCRGIPWIAIPTTLLAMVDASIGGKNGVNAPHIKNFFGTFYPSVETRLNLDYLKTLPQDELRNGFVEMIKHALIADEELLEPDLSHIEKSRAIKQNIVTHDEKENGLRRILNFGHTVGHALEAYFDYQITHGQAVAWGILVESRLSYELGYLSLTYLSTINKLMGDYITKLPAMVDKERLLAIMNVDKKALRQKPRFVILEKIGKCCDFNGEYCTHVLIEQISSACSILET